MKGFALPHRKVPAVLRKLPAAVLAVSLCLVPAADAASKKEKKLAAKIQKKVAGGHYVGYRGDGESIDDIFCADGRYYSNTGGGISEGNKWNIVFPRQTKKGFTAVIKSGSFSESIALLDGQWQIGYVSFDEPEALGDVERTDAKEECAAL